MWGLTLTMCAVIQIRTARSSETLRPSHQYSQNLWPGTGHVSTRRTCEEWRGAGQQHGRQPELSLIKPCSSTLRFTYRAGAGSVTLSMHGDSQSVGRACRCIARFRRLTMRDEHVCRSHMMQQDASHAHRLHSGTQGRTRHAQSVGRIRTSGRLKHHRSHCRPTVNWIIAPSSELGWVSNCLLGGQLRGSCTALPPATASTRIEEQQQARRRKCTGHLHHQPCGTCGQQNNGHS
jgi:hypothetical protein